VRILDKKLVGRIDIYVDVVKANELQHELFEALSRWRCRRDYDGRGKRLFTTYRELYGRIIDYVLWRKGVYEVVFEDVYSDVNRLYIFKEGEGDPIAVVTLFETGDEPFSADFQVLVEDENVVKELKEIAEEINELVEEARKFTDLSIFKPIEHLDIKMKGKPAMIRVGSGRESIGRKQRS
jgi:hypothetical protein